MVFDALVRDYQPTEFHHGCCVGADEETACNVHFARRLPQNQEAWGSRCKIHAHPSDLKGMVSDLAKEVSDVVMPSKAPLDRNKTIVNACDVLIACPKGPEEQRSGTWATVRYARKQGKRIMVIESDGTIVAENLEPRT